MSYFFFGGHSVVYKIAVVGYVHNYITSVICITTAITTA